MVQGKAGAQRVADNAVPATKRFNEEQLKPGADKAGEGLKTGADRASQGLQNAADQVSQQAGRHVCCLLRADVYQSCCKVCMMSKAHSRA